LFHPPDEKYYSNADILKEQILKENKNKSGAAKQPLNKQKKIIKAILDLQKIYEKDSTLILVLSI